MAAKKKDWVRVFQDWWICLIKHHLLQMKNCKAISHFHSRFIPGDLSLSWGRKKKCADITKQDSDWRWCICLWCYHTGSHNFFQVMQQKSHSLEVKYYPTFFKRLWISHLHPHIKLVAQTRWKLVFQVRNWLAKVIARIDCPQLLLLLLAY